VTTTLDRVEVVIYQTDTVSSTGMVRAGEAVKRLRVCLGTIFREMSAGIQECIRNKKSLEGLFLREKIFAILNSFCSN